LTWALRSQKFTLKPEIFPPDRAPISACPPSCKKV
jgi:hypothetical protein